MQQTSSLRSPSGDTHGTETASGAPMTSRLAHYSRTSVAHRMLRALCPLVILVACGGEGADGERGTIEPVTVVRAAGVGCETAGTLEYLRTLEPAEPYTASELLLRGFDVSGDELHLMYVSWAPGKCARIVRSLDLGTGARRTALEAPDSCSFSDVPGELATIDRVHYVRSSTGKRDRLVRWDSSGQPEIGALPPAALGHLGADAARSRLVGSDAQGNLFALAPGADATPLVTIELPSWGPSVGPEVDGDRVWMLRHAFEGGMKNQIGFTSMSKPSKLCTFETEGFPGLRGTSGQLFAVRDDHVYIAAAAPLADGA